MPCSDMPESSEGFLITGFPLNATVPDCIVLVHTLYVLGSTSFEGLVFLWRQALAWGENKMGSAVLLT